MFRTSFAVLLLVPFAASAAEPRFAEHVIARDSPLVREAVMSCVLADLDGDGDLDWTVGTIWPKPKSERSLYWYEYRGPDAWTRHAIGKDAKMYGGACVLDANGDGRTDVVATNLWINGEDDTWTFRSTGIADGAHDMQTADFNGDGTPDLLAFTQRRGLNWFARPTNLNDEWRRHPIGGANFAGGKVHATGSPASVGDLDGDGDPDIAVVHGWYENADGRGEKWAYHRHALFPSTDAERFPWGFAVKTAVADLDGDGDLDVAHSECDTEGPAGIVWLENVNGRGRFELHWIKERVPEDFHTLEQLDFDGDGDVDLLSGTGPLAKAKSDRLYLFENRLGDGEGWRQHVLHEGMPIHEARTGDVDGDGDPDIVVKPWNRKDEPKDFLYFRNLRIDE